MQDTLTEARVLGLRDVQAACLIALAIIANDWQSDLVAALRFNEQTLELYQDLGNRLNEAIAQINIGTGWTLLGAFAKGRDALEAGLRLTRANGDRSMEGQALCILAEVASLMGDHDQAILLARASRDIAVAVEGKDMEADALLNLGIAELCLGKVAGAIAAFEDCRRAAAEIHSMRRHDANAGLARPRLTDGDLVAAHALVSAIVAEVDGGGTLEGAVFPRLIELTCHEVLTAVSDPAAGRWLRMAHGALQETARSISDERLRKAFLHEVPHNRAIVEAFAAASTASVSDPPTYV